MNPVHRETHRNPIRTPAALLPLLVLLLLTGCAARDPAGHLDFQMEINELFESGTVLPDHTYYHIGPDAEPDAIIAIDNRYSLAPSLWKKSEVTAQRLLSWMERIDNTHRFRNSYFGAAIFDSKGERLGVWYSRLKWTVIERGEGNEVIIFTPDTTKGLTHDKSFLDPWGVR